MDTSIWQSIVENDYSLPAGYSVAELTPALLNNLGSANHEMREQSATVLERWLNRGYYSPDGLSQMVTQLVSNLKIGIGEQGTSTVLLRSFSALTLAEIVYYDNEHPFLVESQLRHILENGLAYFHAERDVRGYEAGTGWIHAVAHGSDLLAVLALHEVLQQADLQRILEAIAAKVAPPTSHIYLYNEDQRMVRAVLWTLQRNLLTIDYLSNWLDQITHYEGKPIGIESLFEGDIPAIASITSVSILHNTKQFLRSLYFHLVNAEQQPAIMSQLLPRLQAALEPINAF